MASAIPGRIGRVQTPPLPVRGAEPETRRPPRADWTWVSCLTLVGAMLRLYRIGSNSLWVDEFATLKIVRPPFAEIARAAAEVSFCPPLHFWLVHGVVALLGVSETSLRLVSAVAGALTIPVAWLLIRELTRSRSIALLGAALLAVNPLHIWYSQEARAYALLVLMGTAALLCFVLAARTGKWGFWAGFVAFTVAAVLTHTIAPVILGIAGCWMLLSHRRLAVWRRARSRPRVLRPLPRWRDR